MAANRVYTPEEKLKIVLEGMSGTISIAGLCKKISKAGKILLLEGSANEKCIGDI